MGCDISGEQLWSWIDREAPELEEHLSVCAACRKRADKFRDEIGILASDAATAIPLPDKIGPYTIKRLLGEGGQALVYEAEQSSPRRLVALKVLKGGHLVDKTRVRQFRRETQTLARLNHPSIATIYEAGRTQEGLHYFAMELADGKPLHKYVKEEKPDRKVLLQMFVELCRAIGYAHEHGVIHRDLKPSNIMVDAQGKPKILDFGLARLTHTDLAPTVTATREGRIEGTPRYMSPEQALGKTEQIDARSDAYTLGVILYEILIGVPPNDVTLITEQALKTICEEVPRRPGSIDPSLSGDLDAILLKALEKQPSHRYQTVAALADDITRYLDGEPIVAKPRSALYFVRLKLARRRSWIMAVLVAIAVITIGIWSTTRNTDDPSDTRLDILELKYALFENGPTEYLFELARKTGYRHSEFPEAAIVLTHAYVLNREKNIGIVILKQKLAENPSMWPYKELLDEIDPPQDDVDQEYGGWNDGFAASADAWYLRSLATMDVRKSLEWAAEALRLNPKHRLANATLTNLANMTREPEIALAAVGELINSGESVFNWIYQLVTILTGLNRHQEALDACNELVNRQPDSFNSYYLRARVERRMKHYDDAARDYTKAIEIMREQGSDRGGPFGAAWLHYHRGTVMWLVGDEEGAISDYRNAYDMLTYPTFANARLFILLKQSGRDGEADVCASNVRQARTTEPWLAKIFDCLEGSLAPDQLVSFAETGGNSVQICEAYYYAAEVLLLRGSVSDAIEYFRKCAETGVTCAPEKLLETLSEYELASYRLTQLGQDAP